MPAARLIEIADAVVAELNDAGPGRFGSWPDSVAAVRAYQPQFDLKDMAELHVTVVPGSWDTSPLDRSGDQDDYAVQIGVQKKLSDGSDTDAEVDDLAGLVREIADFLKRRPLPLAPGAVWIRTQNNPFLLAEHLEELRQFTSVLAVTYRVLE